jgi:Ca2+-binding EF-hand superfamily protein
MYSKFIDTPNESKFDEGFSMNIIDRIYYYCTFQFNFTQRQKQNVHDPNEIGFVVDLAAMCHVLDALMKQALHSRLRFIFDLFDLDGDGFLDNSELKAIMDAFLEMFQKSKPSIAGNSGLNEKEEEGYLRAVSSFLSAALKMGSAKSNNTELIGSISKIPASENYLLSYNEFLLAVLSQSVFVEYFERTWTINAEDGNVSVSFLQKP